MIALTGEATTYLRHLVNGFSDEISLKACAVGEGLEASKREIMILCDCNQSSSFSLTCRDAKQRAKSGRYSQGVSDVEYPTRNPQSP
jgi:hypothetical protein